MTTTDNTRTDDTPDDAIEDLLIEIGNRIDDLQAQQAALTQHVLELVTSIKMLGD